MAGVVRRVTHGKAEPTKASGPPHRRRVSEFLANAVSTAIVVGLLAAVAIARLPATRTTIPAAAVVGGAPNGTPDELKAAAADLLEAATNPGGTGYRFEIAQRSTIHARPGGPKIEVPDPIDRHKSLGFADEYYLIGLTETGYVTPAGFSMEMRQGPPTPDAKVDPTSGQLLFRALSEKGLIQRDDGTGWYKTDNPPGIGLDPRTAGLLPTLLRNASEARDADPGDFGRELDPGPDPATRGVAAAAEVKDVPGVVAADGEGLTELTEPIKFSFDAAGRLNGLVVAARNTRMTRFDLIVITEISIRYDDVPVDLPDPTKVQP